MLSGILGLIACCLGIYATLRKDYTDTKEELAINEFKLGFKETVNMFLGHTLIVGATGSGKSTCINTLIPQMIDRGYNLNIIDLKVVEFIDYLSNVNKYVTKEESVLSFLEDLLEEIQSRLNYMVLHREKNYIYSPSVVIIDEFQRLMENKKIKNLLFEIISISRATNIFIFLSCQSPRSEILDGRIRDNIMNTVIFRCETNIASEIATGVKGDYRATYLTIPGRGFLKFKGEYLEFY